MAEYKGSILELNNKKAIVMTEKCDFISIKRTPDMFVGQQLVFNEAKPIKKTNRYIRYATLAASVFVLALFSVLYLQVFAPVKVFAYVDVDINPSIEFAVDPSSKVLSIKALNTDAQKLLKELRLEEMPVKTAISQVIEYSKEMGYLSEEKSNKVLVSASLGSEGSEATADNDKALSSLLTDIQSLKVEIGSTSIQPDILKLTPERRKAAVENNISMGRYELYMEIKDSDLDITIEKAKTDRVSDMLDKVKNSKSSSIDKDIEKSPDKKDNNNNSGKQKADMQDGGNKVKDNNNNNKDSEAIGEHEAEIRNASGRPDNRDKLNKASDNKPAKRDKSDKQVPTTEQDKSDKPSNQGNTDKNKPQKGSKSQSDSDWPEDYTDKKNEESTDGISPDNKTKVTDESTNNTTNEGFGNKNVESSKKSKKDSGNSNSNNNNNNNNNSNNNSNSSSNNNSNSNSNTNSNSSSNSNNNSNSNESSNNSGSSNENSGNSKEHNKNKEK